jgi:type IV pilus assembly protein PilY1
MKDIRSIRRILTSMALAASALLAVPQALAQLADLADTPLANSPSTSVLPNLMYILDDSGSMAWNYMPDFIQTTSQGDTYANCRVCTSSSCTGPGGTGTPGSPCGNSNSNANTEMGNGTPVYGEAPFYANAFNKIWYNPDITYSPAVDSTGASFGNMPATAAQTDAYLDTSTTNLLTQFQEVIYCNVTSPSTSNKADTTKCRYNGRHNVTPFSGTTNYFTYGPSTGANAGFPTTSFYNKILVTNSNAHYYNITPNEYCSDVSLTTCALALANGSAPAGFSIPAPIRWCKSAADAILATVVSGNSSGTARCRKKFDKVAAYVYPRYGRFQRVDIVSTTPVYPKSATSVRTDCASSTTCTYGEEVQNFANWWSFYRIRLSLMKTSTGRAFLSIDDRFKVGFITINPNSPVTSDKFVPVSKFNAAQRTSFYTTLYSQATNGSTPLREALSRVGRYYAGVSSGINNGMIAGSSKPDPMEYSCQTNYALLTTDGYWNGNAGQNLSGGAVGNQDNSNTGYTTRALGSYDGALAGASDTLADVAAYYYKTDLRTSGALAPNNVPTNAKDTNTTQHMVTFSLGLGLEGFMDYITNYETSLTGDFAKIKTGSNNACSWTNGTCDWPVPSGNDPAALDDLWHAAVNGRGTYFSASDPNSLAQGLQSALSQLRVATAAAAASATSSPNITQTDNFIYSSTFRTAKWDGEVVAQQIDTITGNVLPTIVWSAQANLDLKAASNARVIYTIDEAGAGKRKLFTFATLSAVAGGNGIAAEQSYFANKCGVLSQCTLLTLAQQVIANSGINLVNYLNGDRTYETFNAPDTAAPFRTRDHVLGDPVNATPAFVKAPQFNFGDVVTPAYGAYKVAQASRQGMLYIAANDGMLHALNGDTGDEVWAYVPRIVMPRMARIATANWSATHVFTVDGSPQTMDVFIGGAWKTILVAGLNSGGRGYYAIDVTTPSTPVVLWEFCSDSTLCVLNDTDIGFTYGNPLITKRPSDGKWVVYVTSGMNNVSPGTGKGFLWTLDAATGAVLSKVTTGDGTLAIPSGFSHISGFADNFDIDNTARLIYGGDLDGNVWRFDTSSATPVVTTLAVLKDAGGKVQPITSRPELALINGFPVVYVGTGRYLGVSDLQDPATLGLPYAYQQSLYAIKDKGTQYANFRAANVVVQTLIDSGTTRSTSQNAVDWTTKDGWYLDFNPGGTSPGERVNLDPQLVQGTLVVVSNVPNNSACTIGGDSFIYQFDYKTGQFVSSSAGNVAGQKYTGQITVGVVVVRLPSGVFKGIATGAAGTKTPFAVNIGGGGGSARRISWRELIQK